MICTKCRADKPETEFVRERRNKFRNYKSWCKECCAKQTRLWKADNRVSLKEYALRYDLLRHYGLSLEQYNDLLERQGGVCAICHRPPSGKGSGGKLHVDHDHKTGENRALLCIGCNRGIGYFEEDILRMESAIAYLKKIH